MTSITFSSVICLVTRKLSTCRGRSSAPCRTGSRRASRTWRRWARGARGAGPPSPSARPCTRWPRGGTQRRAIRARGTPGSRPSRRRRGGGRGAEREAETPSARDGPPRAPGEGGAVPRRTTGRRSAASFPGILILRASEVKGRVEETSPFQAVSKGRAPWPPHSPARRRRLEGRFGRGLRGALAVDEDDLAEPDLVTIGKDDRRRHRPGTAVGSVLAPEILDRGDLARDRYPSLIS